MATAKKKEKKAIMSCASSGHINKLKQSIYAPSISMGAYVLKLNESRFKSSHKEYYHEVLFVWNTYFYKD